MYFISLGAGQCSSALAILIADRDPRVAKYHYFRRAIFADTREEFPATYAFLGFLREYLEQREVSVRVVDVWEFPTPRKLPPLSSWNLKPASNRRYCTADYKTGPIKRYYRSLGLKKVYELIGYTLEERSRMWEGGPKWIDHFYPLIEAGITRGDCQRIIWDAGLPVPPRSGCWCCPYLDNRRKLLVHALQTGIKDLRDYFE